MKPNNFSLKVAVSLLGLLLSAATASAGLHLAGAQVLDDDGQPTYLHGFNWFGFNTGTTMVDGLWGGPSLASDFATVVLRQKLLGFNAVRLPFSFKDFNMTARSFVIQPCTLPTALEVAASVTPPGKPVAGPAPPLPSPPARTAGVCNGYLPNTTTFDRYVWTVQFYARNGFYVLVDNHLREDQTAVEDPAGWVKQWARLAAALAAEPATRGRLIIDVLNEPDNVGIRWEAVPGKPALEELYIDAMDAIEAAAPGLLFAVEGAGQGAINTNWGDGFSTDSELITALGMSDPNPFFTELMSKPYRDRLFLAPHVYPASVSYSYTNASGPGLYYRLSTSFGTKMTEGYCKAGDCQRFPVIIGEFGSKFTVENDTVTMADMARYFNNEGAAKDGEHQPISNWFYWSWNPNSGDTGGLVNDTWVGIEWNKIKYLNTLGLAAHTGPAFDQAAPPTPAPPPPTGPLPVVPPPSPPPSAACVPRKWSVVAAATMLSAVWSAALL